MPNGPGKLTASQREEIALKQIRAALRGLKFGTLTVVVQDGVVIQLEVTSKTRIDYSALDKVSGGEGI